LPDAPVRHQRNVVLAQQLDGANHALAEEGFHRLLRPPALAALAEPVLPHVPLLRLDREQPEACADVRQAAGLAEDAEELLHALVGPLAAIQRCAVEGAKEARGEEDFVEGRSQRMTYYGHRRFSLSSQMTSNRWKRARNPLSVTRRRS